MIQILAVLRQGTTTKKRPYNGEWVRKLRAMVRTHLPLEHRFTVLSDVPVEGVDRIPLEHDLPGWWSKMELFRPELLIPTGVRCLYLDLDCVVLDDLSPLVEHHEGPRMTPNHRADYLERWPDGKKGVRRYRTGCMSWNHGELGYVWQAFFEDRVDIMRAYHGDQDWLGEVLPTLPTFPSEWFENLRFCRPEYPPKDVRVVFCNPWKNHVAGKRFPWVLRAWEAHWGGPKREGILLEELSLP